MQIPLPVRAPTWVSTRRLLEQKLSDIFKCTDLKQLKQLHAVIYKHDLQADLYFAPKLITGFSLCRQMALAVNVFKQVQEPNVHLYNSLIRAYVHNSQPSGAFCALFVMQYRGLWPDNFTYALLLKACCGMSELRLARMIHAQVEKLGFLADIVVPNSLIDSYCKCGLLGVGEARKLFTVMGERDIVSWNTMIGGLVKANELIEARRLFDEMPGRDTVSWNTMLDGYSKAGEMDTAFELFQKMAGRNIVSWTTVIYGYCKAGEMEMARILFDNMPAKNTKTSCLNSEDWIKCSTHVGNALVDMYAKCGSLNRALTIFNGMANKDLVSWNSMIQGLAMHGYGEKALKLFYRMKQEGFAPDRVTFIGVLCACTHAGFVDKGIHYFNAMETEYGVLQEIEHYGCVIDLLGRGGRLEEAFRLVRSMPMEPNAIIWGSLVVACRMHNASEYAKEVLHHLIKLEPTDASHFSILSSIHAAEGDWNSVASVRMQMKSTGTQKPSGASSIELDDQVHEFTVLDKSHPKSDSIYEVIDGLSLHLKPVGYFPKATAEVLS
ncbi:hypothetical protein C3L33_12164, partial [Rhododendron williamsianum]